MTRAANAEWVWIEPKVLLAAHDEQLAEHGGAAPYLGDLYAIPNRPA